MLKLKSLLKMKDMDKGEKKSNLSKHTIKVLVGFSVALVMGIYTNVGIHPSDQVGASLNVDAATITAPPNADVVNEVDKKQEDEVAKSISDEDYNNLCRIVESESGDSDVEGRMLVANVVFNRVANAEFPNTISGVILMKGQFSPVSNGSFYRVKVSQKTITAVNRVLAGEDISQGALYFMNRAGSSKKNIRWFDSHLTYLFKHGGHEFFK